MRRGKAVRDQNDLPVGRVPIGQIEPRKLQRMLNVGEVGWQLHLADFRPRHVDAVADHWIGDRDRFRQQINDLVADCKGRPFYFQFKMD